MSDPLVTITVGSHFFRLNRIHPRMYPIIHQFITPYVEKGLVRQPGGRFRMEPVRVYASATTDRSEFRFHKNLLTKFLNHLKFHHIAESLYEVKELSFFPVEAIDVSMDKKFELREIQVSAVDYITDITEENRSKLVPLPTGTGKTVVEAAAISQIKERTIIIVKPQFIKKWIKDLQEILGVATKDMLVVQGSANLQGLIEMGRNGLITSPFILISNRTMQNWIKNYERFKDDIKELGYECFPEELFQITKSGHRLIDEVHMDFHLNFKLDLYTHCNSSTSLSATLLNNNPFMEQMYEIAYPLDKRFQAPPPKRYIDAYALLYHLDPHSHVRTQEYGSTIYSHMAFEKSILRNPRLMNNYWKIIQTAVNDYYVDGYTKGDRLAVFCSSIAMCTEVAKRLKQSYPHLDVRRYVEDDPIENLYSADVRVTTILSGGTGHDIHDLKTVLLTIAVDSVQANIQTLGRLRELKNGKTPIFVYMTCVDIDKHLDYHKRKSNMLEHRAKSVRQIYSKFAL